jgi:hypothetical protein
MEYRQFIHGASASRGYIHWRSPRRFDNIVGADGQDVARKPIPTRIEGEDAQAKMKKRIATQYVQFEVAV